MSTFKFGPLRLDASEFGSQGSAILGIRDSGKTYTATAMAEALFDAGVPFVAFDPIGVWRFLQVPGKGKGYPIVVAGGAAGDLPLTPQSAPAIVEAAMHEGVSLVIDLFHIDLSKADWRRIVKDCVRLLLHKNKPHGLRHIFLEEAAEFAPQKIMDGDVYAEIEKLARMGGNAGLGYTLINQRSQEVNKAVLELCDNLFLHRQRGKNAIESLDKWLSTAGNDAREIVKSLPDLPQGQCWAWIGGDKPTPPQLIKVPAKNSLHPDRRVMRGDSEETKAKPVNVAKFVGALQKALPAIEEQAAANDPKKLRARIAELERAREAAPKVASREELHAEWLRGWGDCEVAVKERGDERWRDGFRSGALAMRSAIQDQVREAIENAGCEVPEPPVEPVDARTEALINGPGVGRPLGFMATHTQAVRVQATLTARDAHRTALTRTATPEGLGSGHMRILEALAFWRSLGIEQPTKQQVAAAAGMAHGGGTFSTYLSKLQTGGFIERGGGYISATTAGRKAAPPLDNATTARERVGKLLGASHARILDALPRDGRAMTREALAQASDLAGNGGTFSTYLSKLSSLGLIIRQGNQIRVVDWLWADQGRRT